VFVRISFRASRTARDYLKADGSFRQNFLFTRGIKTASLGFQIGTDSPRQSIVPESKTAARFVKTPRPVNPETGMCLRVRLTCGHRQHRQTAKWSGYNYVLRCGKPVNTFDKQVLRTQQNEHFQNDDISFPS
jgi:hypothetical protein